MSELVNSSYGTLYLIPTPLGKTPANNSLPPEVLHIIRSIDVFMVEQIKSATRFLDWAGHTIPPYNIDFYELNKHTKSQEMIHYLKPLKAGRNAGILSEAGAPGIADPGARFINMAHVAGIQVRPLVGPCSILLGLMASGFNGQSFCFNGYLPRHSSKRKAAIRELEATSKTHNRTEIFMETPYRNKELLNDVASICKPQTKFCIAANLTLADEIVISQPISWWRQSNFKIGKDPCMFLLYAH